MLLVRVEAVAVASVNGWHTDCSNNRSRTLGSGCLTEHARSGADDSNSKSKNSHCRTAVAILATVSRS